MGNPRFEDPSFSVGVDSAQTAYEKEFERIFGKRYKCYCCNHYFNSISDPNLELDQKTNSKEPVCGSCLKDIICH